MHVVLTSKEDIACVNWLAVADQIGQHAKRKIADVMDAAAAQVKDLAPGETRKFVIEIGTVEITREISEDSKKLVAELG